ncbi:MAG: DNA-processing protein DprA [Bacteroidales bacterium]|nr:DNA-processing protein DprA [Candidatus Scybalocola fimicaballi]
MWNSNSDALYGLALTFVHGVGSAKIKELSQKFETLGDVFALPEKLLVEKCRLNPSAAKAISGNGATLLRLAEREIEYAQKDGVRILSLYDEDYPSKLASRRGDTPFFLYYKGTTSLNNRKIISIVGTRNMTHYGKAFVESFVADIAKLYPDVLIVSGLAKGVDITSHCAALENGLDTLAVMGTNIGTVYPAVHRRYIKDILAHGGLMTQFQYQSSTDNKNFVERNRIIAAIADVVVVVESKGNGGSMYTADWSHRYGVPLCALPGDYTRVQSEGCNALIRSGKAHLITSAADVDEILSGNNSLSGLPNHGIKTIAPKSPQTPTLSDLNLDGDKKLIVEFLASAGASHKDIIARHLGKPIAEVADMLFDLEMDGIVRETMGGGYEME